MAKNSKRYNELLKNSKDFKSTDLKEIIEMIKKNSTSKFDESIDVSLRIGLKQSKGGDFNLRTVTQLPAGTGKKVRVAVLCEPDKVDEAKKSGADVAGAEDLFAILQILTDLADRRAIGVKNVTRINEKSRLQLPLVFHKG